MTINAVIVIEWFLIAVGAAAFLAAYGRPWKYVDRVMSWHIASVTAVALLEIVGLFFASVSLVPSAIAYGLSVGIIYWRLWLLWRSRRRRKS